ncbi:bifunctional RNase H/acid phosphatase [Corynebacterium jeikeium]|uniref:RnhA protein n=1 Tax=Corynebacterium jeikeium (strain K411) TaxID=306537 RepID=Q4JWH6_CORJK|nr:bifunctional RNase H/acid phosphatase [Corynebacterium jeikeium]CAI36831.1 rnhA [Corynebacterium jeikeium K411]SUY85814.1 bifunctional RNase H/acid phosphatase [Corynebacterium jeikeium]
MRLDVECDGGSRGNPGIAGCGSSVLEGDQEVAARWEFIAKATNNVAEYQGLINALELAIEVAKIRGVAAGDLEIQVRMDSKLVVEQMSGRWKIKHPDMKPLAARVKELEATLAAVTYNWVPRAQNKRADELANRAMDDGVGGRWFDDALSFQPAADSAEADGDAAPAPAGTAGAEATGAEAVTDAASAPEWHPGGKPTRLWVLRHGQTEMSVKKQFSGLSDPELTSHGHEQARRAAAYVAGQLAGGAGGSAGPVAIYSSPLKRTRQTAEAVAEALATSPRVHVTEALIEMNFGDWEGRTFAEVMDEFPLEHDACFWDSSAAPSGGESPDDVLARVRPFLRDVARNHPGEDVVLVSHVTPIKSILRHALCASGALYRTLHLDLAGLSVIEIFPDGSNGSGGEVGVNNKGSNKDSAVVRRVNDTHFLDGETVR